MNPPQQALLRGTCLCGRRYRIQNAYAGAVVNCPACRREIRVSETDLGLAASDERPIPIQEAVEPQSMPEAIDHGAAGAAPPHLWWVDVLLEPEPPILPRPLLNDLLASFYFVGSLRNALNVLLNAVACSLSMLLLSLLLPLALLVPVILVSAIPSFVIALYLIQFFWSVLRKTAAGEDVIPWVSSDWALWEDGFKPASWLLVIGTVCSLPAWAVEWLAPPNAPWIDAASLAALLGGWFFWPAAVMSVALGETLLFARPDWLVRCVAAIGPAYLLAWALTMLLLSGWRLVYEMVGTGLITPLVGVFVNIYISYVLFRTLGLLFRHFRERLPWRF